MGLFPEKVIERMMLKLKPKIASHITGIESIAGPKTEGWFVGVPMTPGMMLADPERGVDLIVECCHIAAEAGAQVVGLGAYTAIIGNSGMDVAARSPIPVTTGNSYTVATAIEGAVKAAKLVGIKPSEAVLAVVGATGSIGRTCALALAPSFSKTILVGRDRERTEALTESVVRSSASTDPHAIQEADVVITVTSAENAIIEPRHLSPGTVVCDVSRPRDVSVRVARERPDVLVIEGGIVKVPGPVRFNFEFGFPEGTAYACMSETMLLALEDRAESYTLGKEVSVEQVDETQEWATRHGFKLDGFRAFEKEVTADRVARVKEARKTRSPRQGVVA